ncbi:GrpB family protein [Hymenobacter crusticola]|uniref:GrpB family protein n=1 Tax=Hymenobacter crusticola TaxID=1770526 RepID=A0A243W663_9BACT|nr:GrpB family protein [Hymenobacter crusticola]OUJ68997.1 hypothetical protein BXP70_27195 [Hymenobacter crusticola]
MANLPIFGSSRPVVLVPYQATWADEFATLAQRIQVLVGADLVSIDHIGSTAVPGLVAKDVLDVQLTVTNLEYAPALLEPLAQAGFRLRPGFEYDIFHGLPPHALDLRKCYLREPAGERRVHLHVREAGRFNTRYALLFRDYLRANPAARQEYGLMKSRAATLFPSSIAGYLYLKEPVFHLVYQAAMLWADQVNWPLG